MILEGPKTSLADISTNKGYDLNSLMSSLS